MGRKRSKSWRKQSVNGRFVRQRNRSWDGTNWNDGYLDIKGRFRVYCPDYPNAYAEGYCLRAHVVWWLAHGEPHPTGTNLHHKNGVKDDDRLENLELKTHGGHTRDHHKLPDVELICEMCEKKFNVRGAKFNARKSEGLKIRFCSQECYHIFPRDERHKDNIRMGLLRAHLKRRK